MITRHSSSKVMVFAVRVRAGVNSAPELKFIDNSNSGIGIELELTSLELNWNCHNWNRN